MARFWIVAVTAAFAVSGCASSADKVAPVYVSPLQYDAYNCQQIGEEARRIAARASEAVGVQNEQARSDATTTAVAIVIFWPAAFFLDGDNEKTAELARLKGELQAIEQSAIRKQCGIVFQKPPAKTG
jgi:hypothetical protein